MFMEQNWLTLSARSTDFVISVAINWFDFRFAGSRTPRSAGVISFEFTGRQARLLLKDGVERRFGIEADLVQYLQDGDLFVRRIGQQPFGLLDPVFVDEFEKAAAQPFVDRR